MTEVDVRDLLPKRSEPELLSQDREDSASHPGGVFLTMLPFRRVDVAGASGWWKYFGTIGKISEGGLMS